LWGGVGFGGRVFFWGVLFGGVFIPFYRSRPKGTRFLASSKVTPVFILYYLFYRDLFLLEFVLGGELLEFAPCSTCLPRISFAGQVAADCDRA